MAGRQKLRALSQEIERLGGDDYVFEQIADGVRIGVIAKELKVSRGHLYRWRDAGGDQRKLAWEAAVKLGGEAHAEKAEEVLDDCPTDPSSAQVSIAKAKSEQHRWAASKQDRERYGEDKSDINLNLGLPSQLLDALRTHGAPQQIEKGNGDGEIVEADYELLPAGEDNSQPVNVSHGEDLDEILAELNGD